MTSWEERIARDSDPTTVLEHVARYRLAAPLVAQSSLWCDLGCGTGIAAAQALDPDGGCRAVLVDQEEDVVAVACRELAAFDVRPLVADLAAVGGVARVAEAVLEGPAGAGRVITCFEVVEHLERFAPLVGQLRALATDHAVDVLMSVPNDAFLATENPYHVTTWGGSAFEELRRLVGDGHVVAHQFPVAGSTVERLDALPAGAAHDVRLVVGERVPSHYVLAFGPRAGQLTGTAAVIQVDLAQHRAWERQREADLEWLRARVDDLEYALAELRASSPAGSADGPDASG